MTWTGTTRKKHQTSTRQPFFSAPKAFGVNNRHHNPVLFWTAVNVTGVSVTQAREIALDVFKANAPELAGIAREKFENREKQFIERYLEEVSRRRPEGLDS